MKALFVAATAAALFMVGGAQAASTVVSAANPLGSTITLGEVASSDYFDLTAGGQVFLQNSSGPSTTSGTPEYGTNAAGVVTTYGNVTQTPVGSSLPDGSYTYGALIATLTLQNGFTDVTQIFQTDAANGLGSGAPPSSLTTGATTFGQVFGSFAAAPSGTLNLRVQDDPAGYGDNTGSFSVTAVPEPLTWVLMILGLFTAGLALRSRRAGQGAIYL